MIKGAPNEKEWRCVWNPVSIIQQIWCAAQDGDAWIEGAYTWIIQEEMPRGGFSHRADVDILPMEIAGLWYYQGYK